MPSFMKSTHKRGILCHHSEMAMECLQSSEYIISNKSWADLHILLDRTNTH